jgi:cytochrome P450
MSVLLSESSRWQRVVRGEWSVADTVSEFLRYETPTLFVARIPLAPLTIAGTQIGPFEPLLVFLAAANRDPAVYDEPDEFRPGRTGATPLSFAFGAHFCLGASLARSEAESMLDAVRRRWPDLRLHPEHALRWHQRGPFRGLDELIVTVSENSGSDPDFATSG